MIELYKIGLDDEFIKNILEQNPSLFELEEKEVIEKIELLKYIGCSDKHIRNIIISNPNYLTRLTEDIIELIRKLSSLGINSFQLFFDSNPFFLNKDAFEVDDYLQEKISLGENIENIVDDLISNPYLIDEI